MKRFDVLLRYFDPNLIINKLLHIYSNSFQNHSIRWFCSSRSQICQINCISMHKKFKTRQIPVQELSKNNL